MARPRGFRSPIRSRRLTDWGFGPRDRDSVFSASSQSAWSTAVTVASEKMTIVRLRGGVRVHLNSADAIGAGFFGAMGIGIVTQPAFAAGGAALPGPLTEANWDGWLWHNFFDIRAVTATIADGVNAAGASLWLPIDSKAMRKIETEEILFGITEVVESVNATMEQQADTRVLLKLS